MMAIHDDCRVILEKTSETMNKYVHRDRAKPTKYSKGDLVMLSQRYIRTYRPCKQLDHEIHGPFEITEVISQVSVHLMLPMKWTIYYVLLYVSLLEAFIQGYQQVKLDKVTHGTDPIEADNEYHVTEVMSSVENKGMVLYLVQWRGFPTRKDWTGENYEHFYSVRANEELGKFHSKNRESPRDLACKSRK
jgi:hypothetical protein